MCSEGESHLFGLVRRLGALAICCFVSFVVSGRCSHADAVQQTQHCLFSHARHTADTCWKRDVQASSFCRERLGVVFS